MTAAPLITVLTPTYNRAATLPRVKASLEAQSFRDFEWVIVDDGSTDHTRDLAKQWVKEREMRIRYVYQANGHKKAAVNHGVNLARGGLVTILDSDDELTPDGLRIFAEAWGSIPQSERSGFSGVRALCIDEHGDVVGDRFPEDRFEASANELLYRYGIRGEKLSCDRVDLLRAAANIYRADIPGFVAEQTLWSALSHGHRALCVNRSVRIYHSSGDALSRTLSWRDLDGNAQGLAYSYTAVLDMDMAWFSAAPLTLFKAAANRARFHRHMSRLGIAKTYGLSNARARALGFAAGWVGSLLYWRDLWCGGGRTPGRRQKT